jgi:outer membrane immunogenic protein
MRVVAGFAAVGISGAASPADLPARTYTKAPPPAYVATVYDWSGFYIGVNGGWGNVYNFWTLQTTAGTFPEGGTNGNGGTVGGQIGYRWQSGPVVFGLEAQGNWANLSGRNTSVAAPNAGFDNTSNLDSFGLFTGQIGYAWDNALLYAKGGAAVTDTKYNDLITGTGAVVVTSSDTRWGGVVGAGLEYGLAPNWSAAVEYDHLFMGNNTESLTTPPTLFATDLISQNVDLVTVRVNYEFGTEAAQNCQRFRVSVHPGGWGTSAPVDAFEVFRYCAHWRRPGACPETSQARRS